MRALLISEEAEKMYKAFGGKVVALVGIPRVSTWGKKIPSLLPLLTALLNKETTVHVLSLSPPRFAFL